MSRAAAGVALLVLAAPAAPAQRVAVTVGPQFALASYREVASGLRYQGSGLGGTLSARYRKLSAEAGVVRLTLDPTTGSAATSGFTAIDVNAWVAYDVATYASVEAGFMRRTADPEFDAQSVGAVRIGARSFYEIGPGATLLFRANYLAAPKFSGGGHAGFSIDLGLGLDVRPTPSSVSTARRIPVGRGRSTRRFRRRWRGWDWRWGSSARRVMTRSGLNPDPFLTVALPAVQSRRTTAHRPSF